MDETLRQLLTLGKEYYVKRDFPNARAYLEQVIERSQSFADVYNMLGVVYHDAGQFSKAQGALEHALALNPAYTEAALNLAVLYNDLGRYDEAKETYGRALERTRREPGDLDPYVAGKIANMHADIGDAYKSAAKIEESISEYRKAVALRPSFGDIRAKLAAALREVGETEEAIAQLQQALSDRPNFTPARLQLGMCYYTTNRIEEALREWSMVLNQDPAMRAHLCTSSSYKVKRRLPTRMCSYITTTPSHVIPAKPGNQWLCVWFPASAALCGDDV